MTVERRKVIRRRADRELLQQIQGMQEFDSGQASKEKRRRRRRAIRHNCTVNMALKIDSRGQAGPRGLDTWTVTEHPVKGRILDVSGVGCSVFSAKPLEIGQELSLVVGLTGGVKIGSKGMVRWMKAVDQRDGYAAGIEFTLIENKDRDLIEKFLTELDATVGL